MGLLDRFFGHGKDADPSAAAGAASTQFRESEPDTEESRASRNAPRRELVQVILRDTMRKHGIPSDWIECRILSTINRRGRPGLHVNFVVKKAHDKMLAYVFPFQESFEREIARFEPRAREWLMSLGWEFQGFNAADMPDPNTWTPGNGVAPLVKPDWSGPPSGFDSSITPEHESGDEDMQKDLAALFAIRDAAMVDTPAKPAEGERRRPGGAPDFQNTEPGEDPGPRRW
jgi:hypothetical protein